MMRSQVFRAVGFLLCGLLIAADAAPPAAAQSVEQFYKGRTISVLIPAATGGVFDLIGRLVSRHLGRFIPGNPNLVTEDLPGAAGVLLANRIYNTSEKDGSVIGLLARAVPQLAIQGDPNVKFDPLKMTWLGSLSSYAEDAYVLVINSRSPVKTIADLRGGNMSIQLGAMNPGTTYLTFAILAREILGLNVNVVRGYTGAGPMFIAMQSGEIDGQVIGLSSIKASQPTLWKEGGLRVLVQFARLNRLAELPDVPTGRELVKNEKDLALLQFAELPFFIALPFIAPPDMPAERAAALQSAFMQMTKDPEYLADAHQLDLDTSAIDGEAVRRLINEMAQTPKDVIERYNAIVGGASAN
jgi:tripartite-type tricarboxylate transporter receptor subunit TctC